MPEPTNETQMNPACLATTTRRDFLRKLAAGTAAAGFAGVPRARAGANSPARLVAPAGVSRVVRTVSEGIITAQVVHRTILRDTLAEGLRMLTGEDRVADAWNSLFTPKDVILLKFNQSAADRLGTSPALAEVLVESLAASGFAPERLMFLEVNDWEGATQRRTRRPDMRWQGSAVKFGSSGEDVFLAALDQATAIINVPFIKTHSLATMTGCLKNLSHGLIRHPARFHSGGCDPAIAEINASPEIRGKLRLNIVNGLRVVFEGGSDADSKWIDAPGTLLLGTDPVACDSVSYGLLNEVRSVRGLPPLLPKAALPRQLQSAERLGIGLADAERIKVFTLRM